MTSEQDLKEPPCWIDNSIETKDSERPSQPKGKYQRPNDPDIEYQVHVQYATRSKVLLCATYVNALLVCFSERRVVNRRCVIWRYDFRTKEMTQIKSFD